MVLLPEVLQVTGERALASRGVAAARQAFEAFATHRRVRPSQPGAGRFMPWFMLTTRGRRSERGTAHSRARARVRVSRECARMSRMRHLAPVFEP
eukprot:COSAG02_NODE_2234_length_9423_cov_7.200343_4_plen_95_part_00